MNSHYLRCSIVLDQRVKILKPKPPWTPSLTNSTLIQFPINNILFTHKLLMPLDMTINERSVYFQHLSQIFQ